MTTLVAVLAGALLFSIAGWLRVRRDCNGVSCAGCAATCTRKEYTDVEA
jgi:hypothetical protein